MFWWDLLILLVIAFIIIGGVGLSVWYDRKKAEIDKDDEGG